MGRCKHRDCARFAKGNALCTFISDEGYAPGYRIQEH